MESVLKIEKLKYKDVLKNDNEYKKIIEQNDSDYEVFDLDFLNN